MLLEHLQNHVLGLLVVAGAEEVRFSPHEREQRVQQGLDALALLRKIQEHAVEALVLEHVRHGVCEFWRFARRVAAKVLGKAAKSVCAAARRAYFCAVTAFELLLLQVNRFLFNDSVVRRRGAWAG